MAFHTQPVWKRAATVFAGPLFNFLLTIAVFAVHVCRSTAASSRSRWSPRSGPDSPAAAAGFLPGDRFVRVDGRSVETFADVQRLVSGRAGDPIVFVMLRDGKEIALTATPEIMEQNDALGNVVKIGVIGVVNNQQLGQPRIITYSPAGALVEAVSETGHIIARTGQFLQRFVVGREDKCQLGGPVRIADMAGKAASARLSSGWCNSSRCCRSGSAFSTFCRFRRSTAAISCSTAIEAVIRRPVSERMMEMVYRAGFTARPWLHGFRFLERSVWVLKS